MAGQVQIRILQKAPVSMKMYRAALFATDSNYRSQPIL